MASRGRIHLSIIFFFLAILPQLASAGPYDRGTPYRPGPNQNRGILKPWKDTGDTKQDAQPANQDPQPAQPVKQDAQPLPNAGAKGELREGFYQQTCPRAEQIIKEALDKAFTTDASLAAGLIRLFFHDCIATGCDASILLDRTPGGEPVEKVAPANGIFVRGFGVIEDVKTQLEKECPGIVSCADILAFANRDSIVFSGLPTYNVAAGRRDSRTSLAKNVDNNVPLPDQNTQQLIALFEKKGLTVEEMVVLSGAHSIGTARCSLILDKFNFQNEVTKRQIEPAFFTSVAFSCGNNPDMIFPFDIMTEYKLDSRYYGQLLQKKALLDSDASLATDPRTNNIMKGLAADQKGWSEKFTRAITKLGEIDVLTGEQGEIRKQCKFFN